MLIDFISNNNIGTYNIKFANIFGLETAVYLNELLNINEKAIRKNKISDCYFHIDREYLQMRTTLCAETQISIENKLIELGIMIKPKDKIDDLKLDVVELVALLSSDDEDLKNGIEKLAKLKKKKSKTESLSDNLKRFVNSGNEIVDEYLKQWVEEVVEKIGRFNKIGVIDGQDKIIKFSNGDVNVAVEIIKIAAINGYKDMDWAINSYKEKHKDEKHLTIFGQNVNINKTLKF